METTENVTAPTISGSTHTDEVLLGAEKDTLPVKIVEITIDTKNETTELSTTKAPITKDERNKIGEDLKTSLKDIGRIPYLLILPLINLIEAQYEKIPESRRQGFARMVGDIKASSKDSIQKIKDRWNTKEEKDARTPEAQKENEPKPVQPI